MSILSKRQSQVDSYVNIKVYYFFIVKFQELVVLKLLERPQLQVNGQPHFRSPKIRSFSCIPQFPLVFAVFQLTLTKGS